MKQKTKHLIDFLTIISLIIGILYASIQAYQRFFPENIKLIQSYLFLTTVNQVQNTFIPNKLIESEDRQLAKSFIMQITKQNEAFNILLNDVIISAFESKTYFDVQSYFCSQIKQEYKNNINYSECSKTNEYLPSPHIATYSLTNVNTTVLENIEIVFATTSKSTPPIPSYDDFIYEGKRK